ncbi:MAG: multidrug efflux pump, rane fusion protein CzcB subfamily [Gammaproteobacteria bacterium]|nr:multidrug efflux pump, rane fusion protein CzcB subfamily [Gammaproteobacteria bacterium]
MTIAVNTSVSKAAVTLLLAAAAACLLAACHRAPPPAAPPALVLALPVHSDASNGSGVVSHPVEVTARYSTSVSFRVPGKLIERRVRLGDPVRQGQVLARLDPLDAQKQEASAKAALAAAEHRLAFAQQQLDRDKAQAEQNLIATNQLEQTQDAFTAALAGRDQAAAQWVVARNSLQYNTLAADHDGVITSENADTGQVVSAGQAVYGLAWTGDTDVILDAAESELGRISIGQAATVTFPALPNHQFAARVREISPAADPQSRTYRVKLTMTELAQAVRLGMTGDATLSPVASGDGTDPDPPTYTVPATALFHKDNSPAVWVVDNSSTLQLRPIKVGRYSDRSTLITAGLHEGDVVVLAGVHTVYAGQPVRPVKPLFDGQDNIDGAAGPAEVVAGPVAR